MSDMSNTEEMTEEQLLALERHQAEEHTKVRRARTGDAERGMRMAPRAQVHPAAHPHAAPSAYADPRPRPSIAYDPLTAEPEIIVEEELTDEPPVDVTGE